MKQPTTDERIEVSQYFGSSFPGFQHHFHVQLGAGALEREALLQRQQDLADAEQADHRNQEVETGQQVRGAERQAQRAGHRVGTTAASAKPSIIVASVLNGGSFDMPMKAQNVSR
jgi:hypothetical protein